MKRGPKVDSVGKRLEPSCCLVVQEGQLQVYEAHASDTRMGGPFISGTAETAELAELIADNAETQTRLIVGAE